MGKIFLLLEKIKTKNSNNHAINNTLTKIGNSIREARISKNQSVHDLASNLKISEQQLHAIEEGRYDLLPERVFVKAMIKKIYEKLQLDTKELIVEFSNQKETKKAEEIVEEINKKSKTKNHINLSFLINIIISGVVGFTASIYMFNLVFNLNNERETQTLIKKIK